MPGGTGKKTHGSGRRAGRPERYSLWDLPNGLLIGGKEYPIRTDFRTAVAYQMAAARGDLTAEGFLRLWFPAEWPDDLEEALEAVGAFYTQGRKTGEARGPVPYDFAVDAGAIYGAFYKEYGVDLGTAGLHWWQFQALLEGLVTHSFRQRVGYRVGDLGDLSAKERAQALRLRQLYAIKDQGQSLQEHLAQLEALAQKAGKEDESWTAVS